MAQKNTEMNTIEMYAVWLFQELKDRGFLKDFRREPETLICADQHQESFLEYFKKRDPKVKDFNLFQKIEYTYDYLLIWEPDTALHLFYDILYGPSRKNILKYGKTAFFANAVPNLNTNTIEHITRIDVKPVAQIANFGKTSTQYTFPIKQRILYDNYGIYIQKLIPIPMSGHGKRSSFFPNYFTPQRYIWTDGGKQLRKIKWPVISMNNFIQKRLNEIEEMKRFENR